jgi:hypothetical protein
VSPIDQEMMAKHTTRFEPGLAAHVACEGILSGGGASAKAGKGEGGDFFLTRFTKDSHGCALLKRFQTMDLELGAMDRGAEVKHLDTMDYGAEVDNMVNGVTSKILHLPPRRRRSRRRARRHDPRCRGGKCKICVFSLFLFYIFNKQMKNKLHVNPPYIIIIMKL